MKTANFNDTVDILVKAYLNGTLEHGSCQMCAVGNIVQAAGAKRYIKVGFTPALIPLDWCGLWRALFVTSYFGIQQPDEDFVSLIPAAEKLIENTGYKPDQLARVEFAFETAPRGENGGDDWMFNGLMAVVDVLADIHNIDLTQKENAKLMFVKS